MKNHNLVKKAYQLAQEQYRGFDIETETALAGLAGFEISVHCWQGDDVTGFENRNSGLSGSGLQVTGNYPGRARNIDELRIDLKQVYSLLPGNHRLNLHAIYGDFKGKVVDRNQIEPEHFKSWVDWAKVNGLKLDFNPTCFAHLNASSGFTLSHPDRNIRAFWVEHINRCRKIGAYFGKELKNPCIHNIWIPDGAKEVPSDRGRYRRLLKESLDKIFKTKYSPKYLKDTLESKLFGIGSESYVVGSHEFYLSYAMRNNKILCLDLGHFHPTESVADKISAILQFSDELLLHISRGVRWDSDHIVTLNDELKSITDEIVRSGQGKKIYIALDYFDASVNRIGAWTLGARAVLKSLLISLLQPYNNLNQNSLEQLAQVQQFKTMPVGAVWDVYCLSKGVPLDSELIAVINDYEKKVTSKRN